MSSTVDENGIPPTNTEFSSVGAGSASASAGAAPPPAAAAARAFSSRAFALRALRCSRCSCAAWPPVIQSSISSRGCAGASASAVASASAAGASGSPFRRRFTLTKPPLSSFSAAAAERSAAAASSAARLAAARSRRSRRFLPEPTGIAALLLWGLGVAAAAGRRWELARQRGCTARHESERSVMSKQEEKVNF